MPNPELPVTAQSHNGSRGQPSAVKEGTIAAIAAEDSRR